MGRLDPAIDLIDGSIPVSQSTPAVNVPEVWALLTYLHGDTALDNYLPLPLTPLPPHLPTFPFPCPYLPTYLGAHVTPSCLRPQFGAFSALLLGLTTSSVNTYLPVLVRLIQLTRLPALPAVALPGC